MSTDFQNPRASARGAVKKTTARVRHTEMTNTTINYLRRCADRKLLEASLTPEMCREIVQMIDHLEAESARLERSAEAGEPSTEQLPDGLQLAVSALEWMSVHASNGAEYESGIHAIRTEHAQRVALQRRIAELESERDEARTEADTLRRERDELASRNTSLVAERAIIIAEAHDNKLRARRLQAERDEMAAALADARREGAEAMREVAAANVDRLSKRLNGSSKQMSRECAVVIRAAQLPGRVVALSDGEKTE